ncbi:carbohydrate kinase family protein [Candidatus Peribacteria bacterium]|nr:carbohydrate kinase family protein [Candidatus Peribacteria bacterium]
MATAKTSTHRQRTLSIGGATYDVFLTMGELRTHENNIQLGIGEKVQVKRVIETCGGGASNTSVGLSRLGLSASFCGIVGSDQWGEKLLENLKKENVNVSSATIVEHETSSFSIVLSLPNGERTILYAPGVNEHLHDTTFDLGAMKGIDAVYLNHLCETSCMIQDDIIEALTKESSTVLAWNPGGSEIAAGMHAEDAAALLKSTTLLLLNKEEALLFSQSKTIEEALKKLTSAGAKNVCITDGKNGTIASDSKKTYRCPILKNIRVVDTTGAGDAFGTAALWALLTGETLQTALISGTLNAASVVASIGAQAGLLTETNIREQLSRNLISVETISSQHL